jgi:alkylhydroperoxidase family enzyme
MTPRHDPAMTFIETVPEDQAEGAVAAMYETDRQVFGRLPNLTTAFSLRPDVYAAWRQLNGAIKANMDLRRYELATIAAAAHLRSSYCMLAHGSVLLNQFLSPDGLRAAVDGRESPELDAVDVAVMALAEKVARDATSVTEADAEGLRALGLTDGEILDVVLAAAARCFFSKVLDGLGVAPDASYRELDAPLRDALTVGRAIAG